MNHTQVAAAAGDFMSRAGLSRDPIVAKDDGNARRLVSCSDVTYTVVSSWYPLMEDCFTELDNDGDGIPEYYSTEYVSSGGTGGVIVASQPSGAPEVHLYFCWELFAALSFGSVWLSHVFVVVSQASSQSCAAISPDIVTRQGCDGSAFCRRCFSRRLISKPGVNLPK